MEADKHRLSDQVGQLQSKLDRAALHRDLIVGMELQKKGPSSEWLPEWASLVQTAGGDARRKTLANLWYARVHRKRTVWKGRLVDPVGQALQGSNSHRGSRILEGPG